ncbi:HAD hydrolase subfamily IA REG-2-like protein [Fomitopsis serialis]|uniref:HAD hydrolase subfamily IA REG-2-like protein n=1 Tax=Fomitopsis serialis TaxID=139415 RepID=UPI002007D507|nr:HAD hydrolase subfamily IA REG-2-like protein [Neoantrodia serialis]KAH9915681.1 HAD hydrolase subfamily IA REG-2-like protein [Neoantrodia serialis]
MAIRAVLFDALFTLVAPRLPIYVQYSQTFEPYLGVLEPDLLKKSFKTALKQVQKEKPAYQSGAEGWWGEVIKRTAVGAGADPQAVDRSLDEIVPRLLHRFSSREGYKLYDDSIPTRASERAPRTAREMFLRACARLGVQPSEAVHVGDELPADYYGAEESGLDALLVRRPGTDGEGEAKEPDEDLSGVAVVSGLAQVVDWVHHKNAPSENGKPSRV